MDQNINILGDLSREEFLEDYWQKEPILIKNAWPNFSDPITPDQLKALAMDEHVESRLVTDRQLTVRDGPFQEDAFKHMPSRQWLLLVQAVDLWIPKARNILKPFDFLPNWRLDDIMVSYAMDNSSVGPHYDNYDVFLLQGIGQKSWQIGNLCVPETTLSEHDHLKLLADFSPREEWVLDTGDMLYIPPRYGHFGISVGECITYSIGFRSPSSIEILNDIAAEVMSRVSHPEYLKDPPLTPCHGRDYITDDYLPIIRNLLLEILQDDRLIMEWFAQYVTEPKYPDLVDITNEERTATVSLVDHSNPKKKNNIVTRFLNGVAK